MKLRIRGNQVRIRIQQKELALLHSNGVLEDKTEFPEGVLLCRVRTSDRVNRLEAHFENSCVELIVPIELVNGWYASDEVSLTGETQTLKLLLEKDFYCLKSRSVWKEDESDAFPNPHSSCGENHG